MFLFASGLVITQKNYRYVDGVIFKTICMLQVCIVLANISTCKSFDLVTSATRLRHFNNE